MAAVLALNIRSMNKSIYTPNMNLLPSTMWPENPVNRHGQVTMPDDNDVKDNAVADW